MSSLPEGDAIAKVDSVIPDSHIISSQSSETISGSQPSQNATAPSQVGPSVSQVIPGTADSVVSSTTQDNASQSQPFQLFSQVAPSNASADTDTSMMPPPTPPGLSQGATSGLARSSGRAIRPTLKLRGDDEEPFSQRTASGSSSQGLLNGSQNYGFRNRKVSTQGNNGNARAPRLKLNLKGGHASRGKGDPTLAGVDKTLPYMQGYDRELDSSDDETGEGMAFEEQLILRMPEGHEATKVLGDWIRKREVGNDGKEVEVKFKDSRRALFKMGDKQFSSKLVDLPAIIESHKTLDNKQVFKIADISQMLLVTHQIREESEVTRGDGLDKVEGLTDDFIYDHGITPPMKWARKRRFRQRIHKRTIETVEKEVERLLAEDERAEKVEYAMIDMAEVDLSDSDDEGEARLRKGGSQGASPSIAPDGASIMSDLEDGFSQLGDQEESGMGLDDDDVDQDLQRELEQEMLLQQQEDEEDEDEEGSTRNSMRGRSMSRATSDDDDDDDDEDEDEEEDDLFDAGDEDEGAAGGDVEEGENEADDDDDDDLDEEEQELRVRETQLEAECKEIEIMVKRKSNEVEATINALIKQRNLQTLKRMQTELDMKKSQLLDLRQQRREGKEAAKAEAQAQAEAAAAAASNRASSSATPNAAAVSSTSTATGIVVPSAVSTQEATPSTVREKGEKVQSATKEVIAAASASRKPITSSVDMEVDGEVQEEPGNDGEEDDDVEEEDEDQDSDESDLFG